MLDMSDFYEIAKISSQPMKPKQSQMHSQTDFFKQDFVDDITTSICLVRVSEFNTNIMILKNK